jgi:uncharacterized delta-60 repeat protein
MFAPPLFSSRIRAFAASLLLFSCAAAAAPGSVRSITLTPFPGGNNAAHRVVETATNKVLVVGYAQFGTRQFALTQYNSDGTLDTSFGRDRNGTMLEPIGPGNGEVWGVALQGDGRIVVAGFVRNEKERFGIARFNGDGTLDESFGGGGAATALGTGDSGAYAVDLQADGKIVVGGYAQGPTGKKVMAVVRYNTNATVDTTFGSGGFVIRPEADGDEVIHSLKVLPGGKIIAAAGGNGYVATLKLNSDGTLDPTWAGGGKGSVAGISGAWDMALQGDGKVLVVGTAPDGVVTDLAVLRLTTTGNPDTTFGTGGIASRPAADGANGYGVVWQSDGTIVASGNAARPTGGSITVIMKFTSTGAADTTFGTSGMATTNISGVDEGQGLAKRANLGFIVAGGARGQGRDSLTVAFTANGALDTGFNGTGYRIEDVGGALASAEGSARQADGKVVLAGTMTVTSNGGTGPAVKSGVFARYLTDGTLDTSFGTSGRSFVGPQLNAVAIQSDGKIVGAGFSLVNPAGSAVPAVSVVRLNADGTPDTTFGTNGVVTVTPIGADENAYAVAIQADGKIVVGGVVRHGVFLDSLFLRFTGTGALDTTFNGTGRKELAISTGSDAVEAIALQSDGKIVSAGWAEISGTQDSFAVARLNTNGTPDAAFGASGDGFVTIHFGALNSSAYALAVRPDGKLVVGGKVTTLPTDDFAMVRLLANGTLDASFGTAGAVTSDFGNHDRIFALALLTSGKIVAAGENGGFFAIAQYLANGTLDTAFGSGGVVALPVNAGADYATGVVVGSDGSLFVSGNGSNIFALALLAGDGAPTLTPTTTSVISSVHPSRIGEQVTFTATVSSSAGTPAGTVDFRDGGTAICSSVTLVGGSATCSTTTLAEGSHPITVFYPGNATYSPSTSAVLTQTVASTSTNVALASRGGVATASTQFGPGYPASAVNNGERGGANWSNGGGWADATADAYPDYLQVAFDGPKLIDRVVVFTLQDNWQAPVAEPTDTMTFTQYGIVDFNVEGWDGVAWQTLATITNNNLVKRNIPVASFNTDRIRIKILRALSSLSRITEVEAYGVPGTPLPPPPGSNVALGSAGATATASSTYGPGFPVSAVNDGARSGANWTNGGGWADATIDAYPDWVQIDFGASKAVDRVVVYTLQDNYQSPSEPSDTMTFTQYGIVDFNVQGWDGGAWVPLATVTGNDLVKRTVTFTAFTTTKIRVNVTRALSSLSRITEIEAWGVPGAGPTPANVALAGAGGVASASSQFSADFPIAAVIDGERAGASWAHGGGWADGTVDAYPDWMQVDFNGAKTIDRVVVYTLQDNYTAPVEPTDSMTFTQYGLLDFSVQGWNGTSWVVLANIVNNNLVKRTVTFTAFTTTRIRVQATRAAASLSRITEVEAWGIPATDVPARSNVAAASAGGVASASSQFDSHFPVSAVNNNERAGAGWGNGGGWADGTLDAYPDWVQVDFSGTKTIDRVVVYTLQDNYASPAEPTDAMTFTQYGIVDFTVEAWNGTAWFPVASATGNNLVKRTLDFDAVATTKIRVRVTRALASISRITEIEAWGFRL